MNKRPISTIVSQAIEAYLDSGMKDKSEIYSKVVQELGVPRPTVRRCARELREIMVEKVKILDWGNELKCQAA